MGEVRARTGRAARSAHLLDLYPRLRDAGPAAVGRPRPMHPLAAAEEALELLPNGQLRVLASTGFLIAYDDPVGARARAVGVLRIASGASEAAERDTEHAATSEQLWGGETAKAVENFPISGETVPRPVVRWLARIKGAAAARQRRAGPARQAHRAQRIERGRATRSPRASTTAQFPIDVFQTGSGTSHEHERQRGDRQRSPATASHPNDHVNMGQSSNDVFPSAVHLAALDVAQNELLPALEQLERSFARKATSFQNVVKSGRTHLMDAVPGHARPGVRRLRRADRARRASACRRARARRPDPARRHGDRHRPEHAPASSPSACARGCARQSGLKQIARAAGPVRGAGQPRRARRALGRAEGDRRLADEDRRRPRADGLGPARRASASCSCPSCRRAPRSCPARSTR